MTKIRLILCVIFSIPVWVSGQDTIQWTYPPDGFFSVETVDKANALLLIEEYFEFVLFSTQEVDTAKRLPVGEYRGYYSDGVRAFYRQHRFDGNYSYLHGLKQVYYPNGKLKEAGQYYRNIKTGTWIFFSETGDTLRTTEYLVPQIDTISNLKNLSNPPLSFDTIDIPERNQFSEHWSIIDFGKNGIECVYANNQPKQIRYYEHGKIIWTETNPRKVNKFLKSRKRTLQTPSYN